MNKQNENNEWFILCCKDINGNECGIENYRTKEEVENVMNEINKHSDNKAYYKTNIEFFN